MTRRLACAVGLLLVGCQSDLGACDIEAATGPIYYDEGGYPAYPGQALVDVSCGASVFCHAQGIPSEDRLGAPSGIDLDVGIATSPDQVERLRLARRVAWNLRHEILTEVQAGRMPPGPPNGDTALAAGARFRAHIGTPDERMLPSIRSPEGQEMLRNWLACGAHVIEGTEGTSQGVGDIYPQGADSSCPTGQAACDGLCLDVTSDRANCGGCGVACGAGQSCVMGRCSCDNGLDACGDSCVDLSTDVSSCGSCNNSCGARFCSGAACVDACPADRTDCGGSCVDLATNVASCGGCGAACGAGETCQGGTCACASGFMLCGGGCVDVRSSAAHCGSCDNACSGGASCVSGACACPSGQTSCGGECVSTAISATNCGACGNACAAGEGCSGGTCVGCGPPVSFSGQVEPIFVARCTSSGCHSGARPAASLLLTTGRAYAELVGTPASCGGGVLVAPGDVGGSYLWNKLNDIAICSGTQMPKRGEYLPQGELDIVRSWICRGALND